MSNVYFEDRRQAGQMLTAELIHKYRYEDCAVVALNDGGVLVGEPIAQTLHSILTMIIAENIEIPGENITIGSVSQGGSFVYNSNLTSFEIQDYMGEFFHVIDESRRIAFQKINRLMGDGGAFDRKLLQNRNIILVADGLNNASVVGAAMEYLKPVKVKKLIVALPIATPSVVDFVHVKADEVHILDVKDNYLGTDHYYSDNHIPRTEEIVKALNNLILNWQ